MEGGESSSELLLRRMRQGEAPLVNGIVLANGDVYPLSLHREWNGLPRAYTATLVPGPRTTLAALAQQGGLSWTHMNGGCVESPDHGVRVCWGEGSFGEDGFVRVERLRDGGLEWVACYDQSNPFREAWLAGGKVHAVSTYDDRWTFDLVQPGAVSVEGCGG